MVNINIHAQKRGFVLLSLSYKEGRFAIQILFPLPEENNEICFDLGGIFPLFLANELRRYLY